MAKRKNAAGLTNDDPFYGAPSLKTFKERLEIAKQAQLGAIAKSKTTRLSDDERKKWEQKQAPFFMDWKNREARSQLFALLRLGEPTANSLGRYEQAFETAQNDVMEAYQSKRKQEREAAESKKDKKKQSGKKPQKAEEKAATKTEGETGKAAAKTEKKAEKKAEKAEEKARKAREREEKKRQKEIARGQSMKRRPRWLYWLIREQAAKKREHEQYLNAGRTALVLGRAIRKIQQKIMAFVGPLIDYAAGLKMPEARLVWSHEPWTPQARNRYNWGKKKELEELWQQFPEGIAEQDTKAAAEDAKRKTKARQIDHAKAIDRVLDQVTRELAEDKHNAVTSSLERSYRQVYADIARELEENRRAIDADKENETRMADARDYTDRRRNAPETRIPRNMPQFGNYGESVVLGAPSPDLVKAVLNAQFDDKDYSGRIWKDRDKLARELKDMMAAAIINGENSRIVAQKLAQRMGVEFSHAQRLVRTEQNRILNQASLDRMKDAGMKKYRFIAIIDDRTCGRCLRKNRKVFKITEKKVGQNFPPLHPYCRCTVAGVPVWEDEGDEGNTPEPPDEQKTIEGWLKEVEAIDKAKADAVRSNPTQTNAQAAADAQDAAMKEAEARQRVAIGAQKKVIQQGKPTKNKKPSGEIGNPKAQGNMEKVAKRSANRTTGDRDADRTTTKQDGAMREIAEEIKREYQAKRTDEEKALIRELVESGRKVTPENIVTIAKGEAGGIVWMETGNKKAGLAHIIERHAKDFEARGIKKEHIPEFVGKALKQGEKIETKANEEGKTVLLKIEGKMYKIAIGSNGYIVTAYPC